MTTCDGCKFADWKKTANGRLHPDKSGRCKRLQEYPLDFRLPVAFWWPSFNQKAPTPHGGGIKRGEPHVEWQRDERVEVACLFKSEEQ